MGTCQTAWIRVGLFVFGLSAVCFWSSGHLGDMNKFLSPIGFQDERAKLKSMTAAASFGAAASGSTGSIFHGPVVRQFSDELKFGPSRPKNVLPSPISWQVFPNTDCKRWGVTTTIAAVTLSVTRVLELGSDWCCVIVADKKTPNKYFPGDVPKNAVILSVADQERIAAQVPFVAKVPWNNFARKNIGYLYAVAWGASVVFDFDDDNELIQKADWPKTVGRTDLLPLTPKDSSGNLDSIHRSGSPVFNPYPMMGSTNPEAWPRGFPMTCVTNRTSYDRNRDENLFPINRVKVFQSLADEDPDVDAVYRLTQRSLHFWFTKAEKMNPIVVPEGELTPYNAQASVHLPEAYWGLLLPGTVTGRVSDIWRSYFTQRLLWDLDFRVAYTAPIVVQKRNAHNYLADMNAETDLYFKTEALVEFLGKWNALHLDTLQARIEHLYVELYKRQYIELADVYAVQDWLEALEMAGYKFPKPVRFNKPRVL